MFGRIFFGVTQNLRVAEDAGLLYFIDVLGRSILEGTFPNDPYGNKNAGCQNDDGKNIDGSLHHFLPQGIHIGFVREMQIADNQEGGKGNKEGIDEEQVEGSEKVAGLSGTQSESGRA